MNCIKCDGNLKTIMAENIQVEQCDKCMGIWFDFGELEKILSNEKIEAIRKMHSINEHYDQQRAVCPKCGGEAKMTRIVKNNINIDTCRICFGQWLDGGEFEKLKQSEGIENLSFVFNAIF